MFSNSRLQFPQTSDAGTNSLATGISIPDGARVGVYPCPDKLSVSVGLMHSGLMPRTTQPKDVETHTSPRGTQITPKRFFRFSVAYFLGELVLNILVSAYVTRSVPNGLFFWAFSTDGTVTGDP